MGEDRKMGWNGNPRGSFFNDLKRVALPKNKNKTDIDRDDGRQDGRSDIEAK